MECKDCTPKDDVDTQVFGNRYSLDDPVGGVLHDENGNIDTRCQPRVLFETVSLQTWEVRLARSFIPLVLADSHRFGCP
jgi:hypothetical protein